MLLKQRVKDHVQELTHLIKSALDGAWSRMSFAGLFGTLSGLFGVRAKNHNEIVNRLFEFGFSSEEVVNSILAFLVCATVEMSLGMFLLCLVKEPNLSMAIIALTNVVNQLLDSEKTSTFLIQAAKTVNSKDISSLTGYVLEALSTCSKYSG